MKESNDGYSPCYFHVGGTTMMLAAKPWAGSLVWHTTLLLMLLSLAACSPQILTMDGLCCGVTGRVTDAATSSAVVGATVSAGGKSAQTNANGHYGIGNVRDAGPNLVRVTHPDYVPTEQWIDINSILTPGDFRLNRK